MIDVAAARADTPGCGHVVHVNNAGASLPPTAVIEAITHFLGEEALVGGYERAERRAAELDDVYQAASSLVGGAPDEWAFVESATRAWNAAMSALRFEPGDRLITTRAEYPSNMAGLLRAREIQGAEIVVAPDDEHGQVDVDALIGLVDDRTRLVSLTHVPTQGGLVNPAERVGEVLAGTDVLFQLDACQSVGQLTVDIDTIGCDILSFTGRKFVRGPRGTGMLWVGERALSRMGAPAGMDMRGASWDSPLAMSFLPGGRRFEPFEVSYGGKLGLAVALRYAERIGIEAIEERNSELAAGLRRALDSIAGVTVTDKGHVRSAIVTFTVDGVPAADAKAALAAQTINVSVTDANSARLDFPERGLDAAVRASVHYFNDDDEIARLVAAVDHLAAHGA